MVTREAPRAMSAGGASAKLVQANGPDHHGGQTVPFDGTFASIR